MRSPNVPPPAALAETHDYPEGRERAAAPRNTQPHPRRRAAKAIPQSAPSHAIAAYELDNLPAASRSKVHSSKPNSESKPLDSIPPRHGSDRTAFPAASLVTHLRSKPPPQFPASQHP